MTVLIILCSLFIIRTLSSLLSASFFPLSRRRVAFSLLRLRYFLFFPFIVIIIATYLLSRVPLFFFFFFNGCYRRVILEVNTPTSTVVVTEKFLFLHDRTSIMFVFYRRSVYCFGIFRFKRSINIFGIILPASEGWRSDL